VIQIQLRRYGIQIGGESPENVLMNTVSTKIFKKQIGRDNFSCFFTWEWVKNIQGYNLIG
jgi:hypothetical protein